MITAIVAGMFFGLPIGWFLRRPKAEGLAAVPDECSHDGCAGRPDPRCAGRNCSEHCQSVTGCHGRCLDVWQQKQLATIGR